MTEQHTPSAALPVALADRSLLPDALRGFALVGIALINIQDFAGFDVWRQVGLDRAVQIFTDVFFNGKSVSLFAMLFGWGAAGLWMRHGAKLYSVRHGLLALIGLLHFVLLWHGDIILDYAVTGMIFMLFLPKLNKKFPHWMWVPLLLFTMMMGLSAMGYALGSEPRMPLAALPEDLHSYSDFVGHQLQGLGDHLGNLFFFPLMSLPYFALGGWMQQNHILSRPHENQEILQKMLKWGLAVGLPASLALAWLNTTDSMANAMLAEIFRIVSGLPMLLAYVALFALWLQKNPNNAIAKALANNGRLALTHYISQTIVFTLIFYPYGLGLYGQWNAAAAVALALVVALLQVGFSGWYLQRFERGPLENLLRKSVYRFK